MTKVKHITHKKSDVANKAPKVGDLANGEIAINYAKDTERLYIKNTSDEIIPFSSDHIIMDSVIDTVLASKTMARGYDVSNPTLANLYGSKESLNSVLSHYKMGLFKDGALVKECAPCRITKAVDGTDINIDGSEGDIMLYTDKPIYRDRCRVSGVTVPNSTATTHNMIGLGLMPHQVGGKEAKKMNPFAFTPSYVQLDRTTNQYHSCYNPSYSGSGLGNEAIVPFFKTNFIGENGAQGGYPVVNESCIENMRRSRAKGSEYKGIFYEFYEMWLIAMYLELGSLYFTDIDSFGVGCCNDYGYSTRPSASNWISGGLGSVLVKNMNGDGVDNYYSLNGLGLYVTANGEEKSSRILEGLLGKNHSNFEEALESQRFVDALVKSNLTNKVDGATVLEYNTDGNIIVSNGVDVASGSGMKVGKKYYVIRNVPNCQGIGDGVMTYVLNVFVKTTLNDNVYYYNYVYNDGKADRLKVDVGGKDVIFKFSYPTYRGLELFSGARTQIEGICYTYGSTATKTVTSFWYAKDFDDIKYDPTNFEASYDAENRLYTDACARKGNDAPFLKGFVKASTVFDEDVDRYGPRYSIINADYDVSLYCITKSDHGSMANYHSYECGSVNGFGAGYSAFNLLFEITIGNGIDDVYTTPGRSFDASWFPTSSGSDYKVAGGFSIGNPSL